MTGKFIKHDAEERIGVVTVMDVGIDFIDQLLKTMRFLLRKVKFPKMNRSFNFCYYTGTMM